MVNDPNPYSAPQVPVNAELDDVLEADERISYSGVVDRMDLRQALRPRLSWSMLAIFMVGSLICCVGAGPEFFMPWRTKIFYRSIVEEVLGVMGFGLLLLGVIHIASAAFGVNWREKRVLAKTRHVYEQAKSGYISSECIYMKDNDGEAWLSWNSVSRYQFGDRVLIVDWGNGAAGGTVFSRDMFQGGGEFERVHRVFKKHVKPEMSLQQLRKMPDYFSTKEMLARQASPKDCIGVSFKELSHRKAFRFVMGQMPKMLTVNCWPLHAYFAVLLVIPMVFAIHYVQCMLIVLAAWAGILSLAVCIAVIQQRHLYLRGKERLLMSRIMFAPQEVHFQTTGSYAILKVEKIDVTKATDEKLYFRIKDTNLDSTFERANFGSDAEWQAVCQLLA